MNKILLIVIILLISCYLILNIKEGFQGKSTSTSTSTSSKAPTTGTIGTSYYRYVDDFFFVGEKLGPKFTNNLESIGRLGVDENVKDLGECMKNCEEKNDCYSFKFFKSPDKSNQKSCVYYKNKVLHNNIINNIQSCKEDNCYYNRRNGKSIPYDDMKQNDTNRFHKNKTACHPEDRTKINISSTLDSQTKTAGHIKQCANICRDNSNCKSFTIFNNVEKITSGPEFKCEYYSDLCSQGTNSSNNLNRHEVYASYDIYDCGEFECRKNINDPGASDDKYNIYCNNNKYSYTDTNKRNEYNSETDCKQAIKNNLTDKNIICQSSCDSGGGIPFDDAKISISSSELPPIYFY
jgi:hypothetical protein